MIDIDKLDAYLRDESKCNDLYNEPNKGGMLFSQIKDSSVIHIVNEKVFS